WHYNPTNESLYVWLPDGGAPGDRVSMGFGERAVDASGTSHVVIRDIAARRAIDGIVIRNSNDVSVRNVSVDDVRDIGIDAAASGTGRTGGNRSSRAGIDAISGIDRIKGGSWSSGLHATSNTIKDSGVRLEGNTIVSLPRRSFAAINVGTHSVVSWKKIDN